MLGNVPENSLVVGTVKWIVRAEMAVLALHTNRPAQPDRLRVVSTDTKVFLMPSSATGLIATVYQARLPQAANLNMWGCRLGVGFGKRGAQPLELGGLV